MNKSLVSKDSENSNGTRKKNQHFHAKNSNGMRDDIIRSQEKKNVIKKVKSIGRKRDIVEIDDGFSSSQTLDKGEKKTVKSKTSGGENLKRRRKKKNKNPKAKFLKGKDSTDRFENCSNLGKAIDSNSDEICKKANILQEIDGTEAYQRSQQVPERAKKKEPNSDSSSFERAVKLKKPRKRNIQRERKVDKEGTLARDQKLLSEDTEPLNKKKKFVEGNIAAPSHPAQGENKAAKRAVKLSHRRKWKAGKWKKKNKETSKKVEVSVKHKEKKLAKEVQSSLPSANWKALQKAMNITEKKEDKWTLVQRSRRKRQFDGSLEKKSSEPEIWFDVDPALLEAENDATVRSNLPSGKASSSVSSESSAGHCTYAVPSKMNMSLAKAGAPPSLTKCVAMDCEMVGIGYKGEKSMLARVSIVNQFGVCIYDKHVLPRERVTDYRTHVSGIRPSDLKNAEDFMKVQKEVYEIMKGRILVGHALRNDLHVLLLRHPRHDIRDTSTYKPFKELFKGNKPSLKNLTKVLLKIQIQDGEHNSVEDAQAAMKIYMLHRVQWEKSLVRHRVPKPRK